MKPLIDDAFISMLEQRDLYIGRSMNGLFGGTRRANAYGSSAEFADYRDYFPGDDLRRIDWNLYARFEKLYLKLYVDERQLHHRIYIDASASMDWGQPSKAETALKLTAALAYLSVRATDRVSIYILHGDKCEPLCPAFSSVRSFYNAAHLLNGVRFKGDCDVAAAITNFEHTGRNDGLSVIISDFLNDNDFRPAVESLLYKGKKVHLLQILSEDEITPSLRGRFFLLDSEGQGEDDERNYRSIITRSRVKAYEKALAWYQNEISSFCKARDVGFITVCSSDPIEKILFFKATEERLIQ